MKPPTLEVADIIRAAGDNFIGRNQGHLCWQQLQVLRAIKHCRTAALGGHLDQCSRCGHRAISFFSCRNRHRPKCQTNARYHWLAARSHELLASAANASGLLETVLSKVHRPPHSFTPQPSSPAHFR